MDPFSHIINRISLIRQIPVFSKLNWAELHNVANKSALVKYKKGDIVYEENSSPDAFYCLISGRLQAYTTNSGGEKTYVEFIHRGMHFGIVSLLTGESHSLTLEAINDSVVLKIEKDDFLSIVNQISQLGIEFSYSLSRRFKNRELHPKSIFESTIISVYGPMKSAGSSTYATNLAFSLEKETGKKVIFVSIAPDQHGNRQSQSELDNASPKWKGDPIQLKEIIGDHQKTLKSISRGKLKIDFLHTVFSPEDSSLVNNISEFVTLLANDYHYVVVDLPTDMDDVVFETLTQSDIVQLITLDGEEDLKLSRQVINRLKSVFKENFVKEKIQVLISGLPPKCYLSYKEINTAIDFDIYTVLPHISSSELSVSVTCEDFTVFMPDPQSEYVKVIAKMARQIGRVLVGLVLGGGAALGIAHIGVIQALEKEKIPIDIVIGSSMGALIGSLWTLGRNADEIESAAKEFSSKMACCFKLLDFVFPKAGLIGGRSIRKWLKKKIGKKIFYDTKVPFKVVVYDLMRREEIVIDEGPVVDAVCQSIAIPGVMNPVMKGDQLIIDGGVVNPLPTNILAAIGIKKIIAVNVLQSPADISKGYDNEKRRLKEKESISFLNSPRTYLGVRIQHALSRIFYPNISDIIIRTLQATEYAIAEQSSEQADVVIHPDLVDMNWFELYRVDELIKRGQEATLRHLDDIKRLVAE